MGLESLFKFFILKSISLIYIKALRKFILLIVAPAFGLKYLYINFIPVYLSKVMSILNLSSIYNFKVLYDISIIDNFYLNKFKIIYSLLNINENFRLFAYTFIERNINSGLINSITNIFKSCNWLEREAWDMFGIFFLNNPDLRRILTDYGFGGYPLKKDFPLSGFVELFFEDITHELTYRPIKLSQELRFFNWENTWFEYIL